MALACAPAQATDNPAGEPAPGAAATQLNQRALAAAALLSTLPETDLARRVNAVNEFVNRNVRFREDIDAHGAIDDWASPGQTLIRGEGDCEDYAIAKYFLLRRAGVPLAQLRLVYTRARVGAADAPPVAHMVLAWVSALPGDALILDNLVDAIVPLSLRTDLTPVFSFNTQGLWQGLSEQTAGDPMQRLWRWREVSARALLEGYGP